MAPLTIGLPGWVRTRAAPARRPWRWRRRCTGDPCSPSTEAVVVLARARPRVRVTWASPCASVGVLSADTDPPTSAIHVTGTLGTGLSLASVTRTTSGSVRSAPTAALCPFPLTISIVVGASAVAVPVNTTGGSPENTALTVCGPTAGMVHRVLAKPLGSVDTLRAHRPGARGTTQVMGRPPIPLPFGSSSRTTRSRAASNPAGAL